MKNVVVGLVVASLMLTGAAQTVIAQNGPGRGQGKGYGAPPQSQEEKAARQAACQEKNGGVCPQGGPKQDCPGLDQGKGNGPGYGKGQGKGAGKGLRDGTGPRAQK